MANVKDINIKDQAYWDNRALEVESMANKRGELSAKKLEKIYKDTFAEMDREIQAFYRKYGELTQSPVFTTLADGSKVISGTSEKLVVTNAEAMKALKKGTRLDALRNQLYEQLKAMSVDQNSQMVMDLSAIANESYAVNTFNVYKGIGVGGNFNQLSKNAVMALIKNEVNGQDFSTRVWNNRDKLANVVNQTLKNGIVQGLSNNEMAKRISANMDSGAYAARRLVQTETTNTLNQAAKQSYEDSGIVQKYKYLATLDSKTSTICAELDGQVFDVKDAVTGLNFPPMHVNCRSTTIPYFDDSPEGLTRMARTLGSDSYVVPVGMSYKEWSEMQ